MLQAGAVLRSAMFILLFRRKLGEKNVDNPGQTSALENLR